MEELRNMISPKPNPQQLSSDWQRRLRQECRNIERQIPDIQREEKNVQKAFRETSKRIDTGSARMARPLKFVANHNVVAYTGDVPENKRVFRSLIEGLRQSRVYYAISTRVSAYEELILEFWTSAVNGRDDQDTPCIRAKIRGKDVVITAEIINRVLQLGDTADTPIKLENNTVFDCLLRMGYEHKYPSLEKKYLPPYWKLLFHVVVHCLSSLKAGMDSLSTTFASLMVALIEDKPFSISKVIFNEMQKNLIAGKKFLMYPRFIQMILNALHREFSVQETPALDIMVLKQDVFSYMLSARGSAHSGSAYAKIGRFADIVEGQQQQQQQAVPQQQTQVPKPVGHSKEQVQPLPPHTNIPEGSSRGNGKEKEVVEGAVETESDSSTDKEMIEMTEYILQLKVPEVPPPTVTQKRTAEETVVDYVPEQSPSGKRRKTIVKPRGKRGTRRGLLLRKSRGQSSKQTKFVSDTPVVVVDAPMSSEFIATTVATTETTTVPPVSSASTAPTSAPLSTPPRDPVYSGDFDSNIFLSTPPGAYQKQDTTEDTPVNIHVLQKRVFDLEVNSLKKTRQIEDLILDGQEKDMQIKELQSQIRFLFDIVQSQQPVQANPSIPEPVVETRETVVESVIEMENVQTDSVGTEIVHTEDLMVETEIEGEVQSAAVNESMVEETTQTVIEDVEEEKDDDEVDDDDVKEDEPKKKDDDGGGDDRFEGSQGSIAGPSGISETEKPSESSGSKSDESKAYEPIDPALETEYERDLYSFKHNESFLDILEEEFDEFEDLDDTEEVVYTDVSGTSMTTLYEDIVFDVCESSTYLRIARVDTAAEGPANPIHVLVPDTISQEKIGAETKEVDPNDVTGKPALYKQYLFSGSVSTKGETFHALSKERK